jgi:transcription initiation factor IIE alpha subunit
MKHTILRIPAVKSESGLSRSTIYFNVARIAGNTDDEIRILVKKLEAARKAAKLQER